LSIADVFLDEGVIVTSRGRSERDVEKWWAKKGQIAPNASLVVLVNASTAAGAEIIASALQDNKRAIVVGQKTHGAGTVQTVLLIDATHVLRLTTSYEYRANNKRLVDAPIIPDCQSDLKKIDLLNLALAVAENGAKACSNQARLPGS
jgi:carboxyl-terminal processing protease